MRRRYRRNFELVPPRPLEPPATHGLTGLTVLGLTVNPRNKQLLLVTTDGANVGIRSLDGKHFRHGSGYYDTTHHGASDRAEEETGYPRSHTPKGAHPKGAGFGTSLYSALALGAYLTEDGDVDIDMNTKGSGICSESEGRSADADYWWDAAVRRGLAERVTSEGEEVCDEYVNVTDRVTAEDINMILSDEERVSYVNEINVDICKSGEDLQIDHLNYSDAFNSDLVIAELIVEIPKDIRVGTELRYIMEATRDGDAHFKDANPDALLAASVIDLSGEAVMLLSLAYAREGRESNIDGLWYRWENGLEPDEEVDQLPLRLTPNQSKSADIRAVLEAREAVMWDKIADLP